MAKVDEFGRPIYETAEEYNKARRASSKPRTYDSPEGAAYQHNPVNENYSYQKAIQRQQNSTGVKNVKKTVRNVIIIIIMFTVGFIFSMFNMVSDSYDEIYQDFEAGWDDIEDSWDDIEDGVNDGYGEYIGDNTVPLPEGFETFSYNGHTVTLPTSYEEIAQLGLVPEEESWENELVPDDYEELINMCTENGTYIGMIRINNYTGEEIPLGKCMVDYIYIENTAIYVDEENVPDFVFGDGLTFESTYEDLEAYFGEPYYHYKDHSGDNYKYDSYQWMYYGDEEVQYVNVVFWHDEMSQVDIEKKSYEDKY